MLVVELENDEEYELYDDICIMSNLMKTMYYSDDIDLKHGETKREEKMELKWVKKNIMKEYEKICNGILLGKNKEYLYNILDYNDVNIIFKLMNLANFLHNDLLIKLIDEKISDDINEMSIVKVKEKYNITDEDMSEEVKDQINMLKNVSVFKDSDGEYSDDDID